MAIDFTAICEAATGRWAEIYQQLCGLPADVLVKKSNDSPCPKCNSKSTIWPAADAASTGRICCRKCMDNKMPNDGISVVAHYAGIGQAEAARAIASIIGFRLSHSQPPSQAPEDLISAVCRDKKLPRDAFLKFEPRIEKRGRRKNDVVRVPVWNEAGEKHSYFDFAVGHKGWFARGNGMAGMFFPGRLPKPGETWLIVEGAKDSAALIGLGYNACGLPTSVMAEKYARLFAGVHVVLVPDLDSAGQAGAQQSGGRLLGIAESVRVARLPGEILEKSGDDVRDVLARDGGEALVRAAIEAAEPWRPRDGEFNPDDGRPEVLMTLAYGWVCDKVTDCLATLGWESPWIPKEKREDLKIYQRGGKLVHVVSEPTPIELRGKVRMCGSVARIKPLPTGQLPLRIQDACQLVIEHEVSGEIEKQAAAPARWLIDGIASSERYRNIKPLTGVITSPTLRSDGSILQQPGYDKSSWILYRPLGDFPTVPEKPSRTDAMNAAAELLTVVKDFPFVDAADRSAWLSLVLSLIGRSAIDGCVPLFPITATTRGSGKSLLADAASLIAYGKPAARTAYSIDDKEQEKKITATAIEALPAVLMDNVDTSLGGASLDAALTAMTWSGRVLGSSATSGELPLRTIWIATGNNLRLTSDIARRVLPIRLASPLENPEERTDIEHPDLLAWVAENRPKLAVAALIILRAYFVAGCPTQQGGVWGSYEAWSAVVRNALVWLGLSDPLQTRETAKTEDQSGGIVAALVGGLLEIDERSEGLTAREIVQELNRDGNAEKYPTLREVISEIATTRGTIDSKRLGYQLRKYRGRVCKGWSIEGEPNRTGVVCWRATRASAGDAGDSENDPQHHPQHQKSSNLPSENAVAGDAGDHFYTKGEFLDKYVCNAHTHTRDTQHIPLGGSAKPTPASHASPADPANCFHEQVEERTSDGRIKTTCRLCGKFFGYRPAEVAR